MADVGLDGCGDGRTGMGRSALPGVVV